MYGFWAKFIKVFQAIRSYVLFPCAFSIFAVVWENDYNSDDMMWLWFGIVVLIVFNFPSSFTTMALEGELSDANSLAKAWKMLAECISEINDRFFKYFEIEGERIFSASPFTFLYYSTKITTTEQGRKYVT